MLQPGTKYTWLLLWYKTNKLQTRHRSGYNRFFTCVLRQKPRKPRIDPTWVCCHLERRTDFPVMKWLPWKYYPFVASSKNSNWPCDNIWDKHKRNLRVLDHHKAFCALSWMQVKRYLETDASIGSLKPGALHSLIPELKSKPLPPEIILIICQNRSLGPQE